MLAHCQYLKLYTLLVCITALRIAQVGLSAAATDIRVCISKGTSNACRNALNDAYGGSGDDQLMFSCTRNTEPNGCLEDVKTGRADVTIVGGECWRTHWIP